MLNAAQSKDSMHFLLHTEAARSAWLAGWHMTADESQCQIAAALQRAAMRHAPHKNHRCCSTILVEYASDAPHRRLYTSTGADDC